MKMKRILVIMTLALVIITTLYINLLIKHNFQQSIIRGKYEDSLQFAIDGFGIDYSRTEKNINEYYYNRTLAMLYCASTLHQYTNEEDIGGRLYSLYSLMQYDTNKNLIIKYQKEIYEQLIKLRQNEENEEALKSLDTIINRIHKEIEQSLKT